MFAGNRKITWNTPERRAVRKLFKANLEEEKLPSVSECKDAIFKNSPLKNRNAVQLKAYINNQITKKSRVSTNLFS